MAIAAGASVHHHHCADSRLMRIVCGRVRMCHMHPCRCPRLVRICRHPGTVLRLYYWWSQKPLTFALSMFFFLRAQPKIDTVLAKIRSLKMVNKSAFGCAQCSILNAHQKYNLANYSPSGGVLQAAVSARLQIFGFDAGRGTPQSLLVWFFEFDSISSLIAAPCEYAFIMAA